MDYFSKFVLYFPLRHATSKNVCNLLVDHIFCMFGVPRILVCDNEKQFGGHEFRQLASKYIEYILRRYTIRNEMLSNAHTKRCPPCYELISKKTIDDGINISKKLHAQYALNKNQGNNLHILLILAVRSS